MNRLFSLLILLLIPLQGFTLTNTYISADGNSLTFGQFASPGSNYVSSMGLTVSYGCYVTNLGHSGDSLDTNVTAFRTLSAMTNANAATYYKNTEILEMWVNGIAQGQSVAQVTSNILTWCQNVKGAYATSKIMLLTSQDANLGSSTLSNRLLSVNTWIKANTGPFWDYVADLRADSRLANYADTTYYQPDGVHHTDAGYSVVGWIVRSNLVFFDRVAALSPSENLFVTPTGSGGTNGSDWNNAYAGLAGIVWGGGAGQLGAGDTLWMAGGTYTNSLNLKGSGVSTSPIQIKRARTTNSECTSATGWSSGFDSQVNINPPLYGIWLEDESTNSFGRWITVDGQITDGIRVNPIDTTLSKGIYIGGEGSFNTTFRNVGVYGRSTNALDSRYSDTWTNEVIGIGTIGYTVSGNWQSSNVYPSQILIDHCTISGLVTALKATFCQGITIQNCDINTIECMTGAPHGNIAYCSRCADLTFRWNQIHDSMFAVGVFFTYFGDLGVRSTNIFIYGNIFRDTTQVSDRCIEIRTEDGTVDGVGGYNTPTIQYGPFFINDNTFTHVKQTININAQLNTNSPSSIRNNLFVDFGVGTGINVESNQFSAFALISNNITNNFYSMFFNPGATNILATPYQWQWTRDLRLVFGSSPIGAGLNLGSPYDVDFSGVSRTTSWDVGAYQYNVKISSLTSQLTGKHIISGRFLKN